MEEVPLCPEWWPLILWNLHTTKVPWKRPIPVNYPIALESILSALNIHTSSYLLSDQKLAQQVRESAVKNIVEMAQKMDELHDQALKTS
ncbi:MAG: hypothetical protein ACR2FN_11170 [Chitinophagaceae bacterium]